MFFKIKKNSNYISIIFLRQFSSIISPKESLPVIKVPKYLTTNLNKIRFNEQKKVEKLRIHEKQRPKSSSEESIKFDKNVCIISSNNKRLNHYLGQTYNESKDIPLISKEWINGRKTKGSQMRFHIYGSNPSKLVNVSSEESPTFESLGLTSNICEAINSMSVTEPTAIQMAAIPSILDYKNVICSAETGSGKTIAYLAPIFQMIREYKELSREQTSTHFPKCLVAVPSRELAEQIGTIAQHLGSYCGVGVATMIGGIPKHMTQSGMDLIVSTIGLVQPLIAKRVYSLKQLNHLVIDESDTLFDESFNHEVLDLLSNILVRDNVEEEEEEVEADELRRSESGSKSIAGVQLVCVSATTPRNLDKTLGTVVDINNNFERINSSRLHRILPHIRQDFYRIDKYERPTKLLELVLKDKQMRRPVMIFSNRTDSSNWIHHYLNDNGIQCLRLNKEVSERDRFDQLKKFQSGECDVISCTDLGSRGLDTVRARHVINYDCPHYVTDYIHRSGRTGRLGVTHNCLVSTFVAFKPDVHMIQRLESAIRLNRPIDSIDDNFRDDFNRRQNKLQTKNQKQRKS